MSIQRFAAPVLMAAALLVSGCSKKDKDKAPAPEPGSGSAQPVPTPPPPPPPAAPDAAVAATGSGSGSGSGSATAPAIAAGDPIGLAKLAAIALVVPGGAPAGGAWHDAQGAVDGNRLVNFVDGKDYWYTVQFIDCRAKVAKDAAKDPADDRGVFTYCYDAPTGKFKDYPMFAPNEFQRAVKVGNVTVVASIAMNGRAKLKGADLETFLGTLDLAGIAKL